MIELQEALRRVLAHPTRAGAERVPVQDAYGRILAEDVVADRDIPPFTKSAMDGYACRGQDLGADLSVRGFVAAGSRYEGEIGPGTCVKIMTGGPVPDGADCVVPVEEAESLAEGRIRFVGSEVPDNIIHRGEDVGQGQVVLGRGRLISPAEIAVLCTVGRTSPLVSRRPRVAILATGDEVVEPWEQPGRSAIRNSNSHQLVAQVRRAGAEPEYWGIAEDKQERIEESLGDASRRSDVLLVSGGVSAGDLDLVPDALRAIGFRPEFEKVAVKPGKPTVFCRRGDQACFGLPGNPVSTFVIFELLVRPLLVQMMGGEYRPREAQARLDGGFRRVRVEREEWVPVVFAAAGKVRAVEYHGSAHIHALCGADGLISIPLGIAEIPADSLVQVRLLV